MVTICFFCDNRERCRYHEAAPNVNSEMKFRTGMKYTKSYKVYDLETGEVTNRSYRSDKERDHALVIEIDEKMATCTKCGYFGTTTNYFVKCRSGGPTTNICSKCMHAHFANDTELFNYVKQKLASRYAGNNNKILKYLQN